MKSALATSVGLSLILLTATANASLVGYYTFDNSTAEDSSGNSNNGVASINSPTFVTGIGGDNTAAQFDGTFNEFFTLPINLNNYSAYTFGAWVYVPSMPAVPPFYGIISADTPGFQSTIDIDSRGGTVGYSALAGDLGTPGQVIGGVPVITQHWQFVAVSYDNVAHTVLLDVDGTLVSGNTGFTVGTNSIMDLGRNPCCDQPFTGYMDNAFVFNSAMNAAQLAAVEAGSALTITPEPGTLSMFLFGAAVVVFSATRAHVRKSALRFRT